MNWPTFAVDCTVVLGFIGLDYLLRRPTAAPLRWKPALLVGITSIVLLQLPYSWNVAEQAYIALAPVILVGDVTTHRIHTATLILAAGIPLALLFSFHYPLPLGLPVTLGVVIVAIAAMTLPRWQARMPIADAVYFVATITVWGMRGLDAMAILGLVLIAGAMLRKWSVAPFAGILAGCVMLSALLPWPWWLT
ncbi:MAG: hypothetical protein ACYDHD_02620 [Vulcanimicrobiaceae bacterium]